MVLFRLMQGAFCAGLSPLSQAVMLDLYPPHKRGNIMAIWGMGVMLGPILGPTLGGYLTDVFNWRYVFYVNVPFGIAAVTGLWMFFKDSPRDTSMKFDWFGFGLLSVGLAALQLMLDRGMDRGWFESGEIIMEGIIGGLAIYLFIVQMATARNPFIPTSIFKDRNFVSALFLMFFMGINVLASSALLPPYLQNLGGYSVTDTGLLMAPRGLGTMFSMMFAGRLALKYDPRKLMIGGSVLLIWSLWDMSGWTPQIGAAQLVGVTFVQGIGMGLLFVPLQLVAFATLPQYLRTDGTSLMNLLRNVGSAIGVSITTTVLAASVQINHAQIAEHVNPFNRALGVNAQSLMWSPQLPFGLQQIDRLVEYNAEVIAYANDFLFMFIISAPVILIIMMMKKPELVPNAPQHIEVME
jgi:DHA2 family multidrug resistance protein